MFTCDDPIMLHLNQTQNEANPNSMSLAFAS